MPKPYKNRVELLQGTLDMLILQILNWGPQHGYGSIRSRSGDFLQVETGPLYPALHRLEEQPWTKSDWRSTENNQRAKYDQLTAAGKKQPVSEQSRWNQMTAAIATVMRPSGETE